MGNIERIEETLQPLIGLKLSAAALAGSMRTLNFGMLRKIQSTPKSGRKGIYGEYSLHIQCPWRIDGPEGIVTGSGDLWTPGEKDDDYDWKTWHYSDGNLQDKILGELFNGYDEENRKHINETELLVVEKIEGEENGGAGIFLSGGYKLILFPSSCQREDWRFFETTGEDSPHFVIEGGKIDEGDDS